ncbi:hypothetical protein MHBO_000054 [Bonamia ostreae]|uniref:Sushi domain-containing protein n=1 Tax=Bonamia ostreae TaxID=126728 RepID=A0ABV2AEZ2_9EUKA
MYAYLYKPCRLTKNNQKCSSNCSDYENYSLVSEIFCRDGIWSDTLYCRKNCDFSGLNIENVDNESLQKCKNTKYGDKCPFKCKTGFKSEGILHCNESKHNNTAKCTQVCFGKPNIDYKSHVIIPSECADLNLNKTCDFRCNGLNSAKTGKVVCDATGNWNITAKCRNGNFVKFAECTGRPQVNDQEIRIFGNHRKFENETYNFECQDNMLPEGEIKCVFDRTKNKADWLSTAKCIKVCNDMPKINTTLITLPENCANSAIKKQCPFQCALPSYFKTGKITCTEKRVWNISAQCQKGCTYLPRLLQRSAILVKSDCNNTKLNHLCDFQCLENGTAKGEIKCVEAGDSTAKWNSSSAKCLKACKLVPSIAKAETSNLKKCVNRPDNSSCVIKCRNSYYLIGKDPTCYDGTWNTSKSFCGNRPITKTETTLTRSIPVNAAAAVAAAIGTISVIISIKTNNALPNIHLDDFEDINPPMDGDINNLEMEEPEIFIIENQI